jgi:predicted nucleic acid-binding protein
MPVGFDTPAINSMNAVDTNVLVKALDADDPVRQAKARDLLDQLIGNPAETTLLWQVAGELLSCLRKWEASGRISAADVEANFRDVLAMFPLSLPTPRILDESFRLRSLFSLSHWDSLLLAGCKEANVTTLYSEDLSDGMDYDGVKVVNPLK